MKRRQLTIDVFRRIRSFSDIWAEWRTGRGTDRDFSSSSPSSQSEEQPTSFFLLRRFILLPPSACLPSHSHFFRPPRLPIIATWESWGALRAFSVAPGLGQSLRQFEFGTFQTSQKKIKSIMQCDYTATSILQQIIRRNPPINSENVGELLFNSPPPPRDSNSNGCRPYSLIETSVFDCKKRWKSKCSNCSKGIH